MNFQSDRVLAVVAHPDDAELLCAGTLARAKADGAGIGICILCQGEKGQPAEAIRDLAAVRATEARAASKLLGSDLFFAGIPDGELFDSPAARLKLIEIYRRFKPTLVLAHSVEDYHPDHRAAGLLAEAATWFCSGRGHRTRSLALPASPALWWIDTIGMTGFEPDFYIDISDFVALKAGMLGCHESQLSRGKDPDFSPLGQIMKHQFVSRGMQAGVDAAEAFRCRNTFKRARAW